MYDGIKLRITDQQTIDNLVAKFEWIDEVGSTSAELLKRSSQVRGLKLKISERGRRVLIVEGSLTRFYQRHNISDLPFTRIIKAIGALEQFLGCSASRIEVKNLEFGLCLACFMPPELIIKGIISQRSKAPGKVLENGKGVYKLFEKEGKSLKVYDKSAYERIKQALIRIEIRLKRKRILNQMGIVTLVDLKKKTVARRLLSAFMEEWKQLLILDPQLNIPSIENENDRLFMYRYSVVSEWQTIKSDATRFRRRQKFDDLIQDNVLQPVKGLIRDQCRTKFERLITS